MLGVGLLALAGIFAAVAYLSRDVIFALVAVAVLIAAITDITTGKISGPRGKWL